ncbi:glycosyltransferase family 8 protein [bacterium]|nr:glycosyltransferase family 8 protein [bacterium]
MYSYSENISPVFSKNNVTVVFSTDNKFVPYLGVAIKSLVDNCSGENNYDIVVLHSKVDEYNQKRLKTFEQKNVSIRFYDMTDAMAQYKEHWYVHWGWSDSVYYRFFIPQIMSDYDKVIFVDGDVIINCDISEWYNIDIENNYLGGVQDISQQMSGYSGEYYRENVLHIEREKYINAGVLSLNIPKLKQIHFTELCIETLKELKNPVFQDQDVINYVCQGHIKYIPHCYNLLWNCIHFFKDAESRMKEETYHEYKEGWKTPKIIHYAGVYKPWKQPWLAYSEYFWKYARETVFYEEIIYKNTKIQPMDRDVIKNAVYRHRIYLQYLRCKFMKALTFGKTKEHYQEKVKKLKLQVMDYRNTLE